MILIRTIPSLNHLLRQVEEAEHGGSSGFVKSGLPPGENHSHFLGKVHLGKSSFWGRKTLILLGENPNWDGDNPQEQVIRGFPGNEGVLFLQRSQSLPDVIFGQL